MPIPQVPFPYFYPSAKLHSASMSSPQNERLHNLNQENNKMSSTSNNSSPINFSLSTDYYYNDISREHHQQRTKSPAIDEHIPDDVNVEID